MDTKYLDNLVLTAGEKASRRQVLLSMIGGTVLYLLRRPGSPRSTATSSPQALSLCPTDPVTQSSLASAKAALAAGKTKVNLSPKGCLTYTITTSGTTTTDTIKANGTSVMITTRGSQLQQKLDADLDGFFELVRIVQKGSNGTLTSRQTQYNPASKAAIAQYKMSQQASTTTVTVSEAVNGTLQPVAMFTISGPDIDAYSTSLTAKMSSGGCSPAQLTELQKTFNTAIGTGLTCMRHYGATEILLDVMFSYVARDLVFGCVAACPPGQAKCIGITPPASINDPANPVEIDLPPFFFSSTLTDYDREAVLWHEFLHSALGYHHDPSDIASSRRFERDRVYACETLCFNRNYDTADSEPTKCSCAVCLKTTSCDKRCSLYKDCNPTFGYICPCPTGPNAFKQFPTCSQCLVTCPSGLGCFGYAYCIPKTVGCKQVTCP